MSVLVDSSLATKFREQRRESKLANGHGICFKYSVNLTYSRVYASNETRRRFLSTTPSGRNFEDSISRSTTPETNSTLSPEFDHKFTRTARLITPDVDLAQFLPEKVSFCGPRKL